MVAFKDQINETERIYLVLENQYKVLMTKYDSTDSETSGAMKKIDEENRRVDCLNTNVNDKINEIRSSMSEINELMRTEGIEYDSFITEKG